YRNPDEDLPQDFEERRQENYEALKQSLDPEVTIEKLKQDMKQALEKLDKGLPKNPNVSVTNKGNGWISLSPLEHQKEPAHVSRLKADVMRRWLMTHLLELLNESD